MMLCGPPARVEVVKVADPAVSAPAPRVVVPSRKVTLPPGTPALEETTAVNVTLVPGLTKLADVVKVAAVGAPFTWRVTLAIAVL